MKLDIPAYLVAFIHTSLDLRIKEREEGFKEFWEKHPEMKENDDVHACITKVRNMIEAQAEEQGYPMKRIYTQPD